MYNLYAEQETARLERELALQRAERLGRHGKPLQQRNPAARRRLATLAPRRRIAPVLRLMGLL